MRTANFYRRMVPRRVALIVLFVLVLIMPIMQSMEGNWFQPTTDVITPGDARSHSQEEPSVAINPNDGNNVVIVAIDERDGRQNQGVPYPWFWIYYTFDGANWVNIRLPNIGSYPYLSDPTVVFGLNDTFYIAGVASSYVRVFVASYTIDRLHQTVTYVRTDLLPPTTGQCTSTCSFDRSIITIDQSTSTIYVACETLSPYQILVAHSTSQGYQWTVVDSGPQLIPQPPSSYSFSALATPVVSPGGNLYVAYFYGLVYNSTDAKLYGNIRIAGSSDSGITFSNPAPTAAVQIVLRASPMLNEILPPISRILSFATNPGDGSLYLAWDDSRNNSKGTDILFVRSGAGGTGWSSPPIIINDDTSTADQFFPAMVATGTSRKNVDVIFYDRRMNPSTTLIDVFHASSADGGLTWQANKRVTTSSFNSTLRQSDCTSSDVYSCPQYFIGDYIGLAAAHPALDTVWLHPAWSAPAPGSVCPKEGCYPSINTSVKTGLSGDINGDCKVDGRDFAILGAHFATKNSDPNWNPSPDLDNNGYVNDKDLAILAKNFLVTC